MKLVSLRIIRNEVLKAVSYRDFHLYYVLKGCMKEEADEAVFDFDNGEMFAVNPGEVHSAEKNTI